MFNIIMIFVLLLNFDSFSAGPDIIGLNPNVRTNIGPGETTVAETTKKNWGVKVDNAQYYDYVEYDDQGRLVDKNHIIIAEGSGASGSGGGSSGQGGYSNNSAGNSNKGISNKKNDTSGIAGAQINGENTRYNEYQQRLNESAIQAEKDRIKNAWRAAQQVTKGASVDAETGFAETTAIRYVPDETTREPISNSNVFGPMPQRETQPKVNTDGPVTETLKETETMESTTKNTPDLEIQREIESSIYESSIQDENVVLDESTIIESENVTAQESVADETTVQESKESEVNETETSVVESSQEIETEPLKKGEDGETDREDETAAFYKEGGENKEDGSGDAIGEINRGVKIFVMDRKGNIGIEEKPGINNIQPLVTAVIVSLLLLIGVLYYYMPYIFVSKKRKKSNYII